MTYTGGMSPDVGRMSEHVRENWGWFLALGIIFIIAGFFAFLTPFIATLVVTAFIGAALAISGVMQIIHAWRMRSWGGFIWQMVIGILILAGGIAVWWDPFAGALTLTVFVAALFVVKGIFQIMLGFRVRPHDGWGWLVAAGVIALLAGILLYINWPFSSLYALGILAGISLAMTGWTYVMIALAARPAPGGSTPRMA